ncbi:hypothetical protein [Nodosilinea sp. P-1105]|uniref:PRC-barrel domain-containing protein n=1 Tax=Nodosilinea sp. P-1105 TaxID=2546229 RepID=UPI00146B2BE4|nr:hypothetical protein [Nodosilinea sp. P-1105]NMF86739.1 hypothetical protein [Nodosilinea sp. P-1105]
MNESFPQGLGKRNLLNHLAINLDTADEFGPITEVWVNGRTHQIQGLGCSSGLLGRQSQRFLWSQVASIGRDGVVIKAGAMTENIDQHLQDCVPLGDLELWSDHGDRVGRITDYRFDPSNGNILQYCFVPEVGSGFAPGVYGLDPLGVISASRRRMMAEEGALRQAPMVAVAEPPSPEPPRPRLPFDRIPLDRLPVDRIPDPRRSWESAVDNTRDMGHQVSEQFHDRRQKLQTEAQQRRQQLQAEAQERLGGFLGNVKKQTRHLRKQLRETVSDVTAGLPSGPRLRDDNAPTIDVEAMELWSEDDSDQPPSRRR